MPSLEQIQNEIELREIQAEIARREGSVVRRDPRQQTRQAATQASEIAQSASDGGQSSPAGALAQGFDLSELGFTTGGELIGRGVGALTGPVAPIASPVLGGVGAAAGLLADRTLSGKKVSKKELVTEFGLTASLGAVGDFIMPPLRKFMSRTPVGVLAGRRSAGKMLRLEIPKNFEHPSQATLDNMFELVRKSGDALSPSSFRKGMSDLTETQFKHVMSALKGIGAGPNDKFFGLGEDAVREFNALVSGKPVAAFDLGKLTHIRSQIRKIAERRHEGAVKDSLEEFIDIIDSGIMNGKFIRGGEALPLLNRARAGWAQLKNFEDTVALINRFTKRSRGGKHFEIRAGAFADAILDPSTPFEKKVARALERNPEWKNQLTSFMQRIEKLNIEDSAFNASEIVRFLTMFAGAGPQSRERFLRVMKSKRGIIKMEDIAPIVNLARRSFEQGNRDPIPNVIP